MVTATADMATATKEQIRLSQQQLNFKIGEYRVLQKPIVVTDMRSDGRYKVTNIGTGWAVNVYLLTPMSDKPAIKQICAPSLHRDKRQAQGA